MHLRMCIHTYTHKVKYAPATLFDTSDIPDQTQVWTAWTGAACKGMSWCSHCDEMVFVGDRIVVTSSLYLHNYVLKGLRATFMWRCANHVGSQYLWLHYSEVDDLCQWVLDSREACQKGASLEDLIKRDVTSTNANKDVPASRGRGEEHNWTTISGLRLMHGNW